MEQASIIKPRTAFTEGQRIDLLLMSAVAANDDMSIILVAGSGRRREGRAAKWHIHRNGHAQGLNTSMGVIRARTLVEAISKANAHLAQQAAAPHAIEEP